MKFCGECGATLSWQIPPGDDRERAVCSRCGVVHYENPRVLVAVFLYHGKKMLWTKRGIDPGKGLWAFPQGFLEKGETLQQAAARELFEETHIVRSPKDMIPMSLGSVLIMDQLYVVFRCPCDEEVPAELTPETEDWGWYSADDAPWKQMAFPETTPQLREIYQWVMEGRFAVRVGEVTREGGDYSVFPLADD